MNNKNECAQYFKLQHDWDRSFLLLKKKWESLGRVGGKVCLKNPSDGEKQAIERFLGRNDWGESVIFSLQEFETMLQKTKFAPVSLKDLLESYFHCEIISNQNRQEETKNQIHLFFQQLRQVLHTEGESSSPILWLMEMERSKSLGYTLVLKQWHQNPEQAALMVQTVVAAIRKSKLYGRDIPLAVLSADVSGNPHYLDRSGVSGSLFMQGICFEQRAPWPKSAAQWKLRLAKAHVLPDDISSTVTSLGVHLLRSDGVHPAIEEFCRMREPVMLTGLNLRSVIDAYTPEGKLFVVENEMVFTYLAERITNSKTALLCTSGQLRNTAFELLDLLFKRGESIYYSGDCDPEGMGIADRLWLRYPNQVKIWRMSEQDYRNSISEEPLDDRRLSLLDSLQNPILRSSAVAMRGNRMAAYQENLLQSLIDDLTHSANHQSKSF